MTTQDHETDYFAVIHNKDEANLLHPLIAFTLLFLTNNGAMMIVLYMIFTRFSLLGFAAVASLILSSVMLWRTS